MHLDTIVLLIDQSASSLGVFLLWFLFIVIGITVLGALLLFEANKIDFKFNLGTEEAEQIVVEPILEPKVALPVHKKPIYPPEDDTIIEEDVEEEPHLQGTPV